ncbi:MAG: nucleotidyl transferase AbiEii/AbiGii toxin family protein [Flavobacterium sp.]|nr:nucleotidyl transferase AbiEii/AbiGii toxin family protein [Flavobacterium sp.]
MALLKHLMAIPALQHFALVGGTALVIRYQHRLSVDLDLFSTKEFINTELVSILEQHFPTFSYRSTNNPIGVFGYINDVKVDFVKHHRFQLIDELIVDNGIRLYSDKDIMAMKVAAILKRAVKKDFWDIAELLKHYSLNDLLEAYHKKYPNQRLAISIPFAITYFADAEDSEDPISLKGQTWQQVKKDIQKKVNDYLK